MLSHDSIELHQIETLKKMHKLCNRMYIKKVHTIEKRKEDLFAIVKGRV